MSRILFALMLAFIVTVAPVLGSAAIAQGMAPMPAQDSAVEGCCGDTELAATCGSTACAPCGSACMVSSVSRGAGAGLGAVLVVQPRAAAPASYLKAPQTAPPRSLPV